MAEALGAVSRVGRGTAVRGLSCAGGRVLTLATLILLTRVLSPKGLGEVLSALAAGVLGASVAMGGIPDAITRNAVSSAEGGGFGRGDMRCALVRLGITLPGIAFLIVLIGYASSGPTDASVISAGFLLAATQGATTIIALIYRARGAASITRRRRIGQNSGARIAVRVHGRQSWHRASCALVGGTRTAYADRGRASEARSGRRRPGTEPGR